MTTQDQGSAAELRRLIAEEQISESALYTITQIEPAKLATLFADSSGRAGLTVDEPALSPDENARVSVRAAQLAYGMEVDDDERLQGILAALTAECGLTLENVARLTGVGTNHLRIALDTPRALDSDVKYRLALRASYLINAASQARAR